MTSPAGCLARQTNSLAEFIDRCQPRNLDELIGLAAGVIQPPENFSSSDVKGSGNNEQAAK